jgi:phospholipid/cholesterol/gamma-HCH transport system ATP-binding protein
MKIEIENLNKRFGDVVVFKNLNLTIEPGEITVIMGRSGSGKSVLLKHLTGLLQPDSGRILIDGKDITKLSERELYPIRMRFGMIFQNGGMLHSLSVGENVALPLIEVRGADTRKTLGRVREVLAHVGLEGREDQAVTTLSGGQRKRVAIARALLQDADCLLFDEPTAGLDPPMSQTVDEIIEQVNEETGATVIVVTHDLVSAFAIGKKLHLLHEGAVIASGTPDEFHATQNQHVQNFLARGAKVGSHSGIHRT